MITMIVREALTRTALREKLGEVKVCGGAATASRALPVIASLRPDLALSEISRPGTNGLEFLENLKALHPQIPAVVLSSHDEAIYTERALRSGAVSSTSPQSGPRLATRSPQ